MEERAMTNISQPNSLVSLRGELIGQDRSGYLLLRNEQGTFRVKTAKDTTTPEQGSQVQVLGSLRSFVFSRCRRHHAYIEAQAITPAGDDDDLLSLFLPMLTVR
jgi:hypothetical protein